MFDQEIENYLQQFQGYMHQRLEAGTKKYGSFLQQHNNDVVNDLEQELIDASNYIFMLWARVQQWKHKVQENQLPDQIVGHDRFVECCNDDHYECPGCSWHGNRPSLKNSRNGEIVKECPSCGGAI